MRRRTLFLVLSVAAPVAALAQPYPSKPIRIIVPFSAATAADIAARQLGPLMAPLIGQSFVIENQLGAGGNIGAASVAKAEPDGYTLMMVGINHVINPFLYKKMPFDPVKDFVPVSKAASAPLVLVVHPSVPSKTLPELIEWLKGRKEGTNYASSGTGGAQHLAGESFRALTGTNLVHVPYKGGAPAMTDLLGGQVPMLFSSLSPVVGPLKAGKLRALAVTSPKRSGAFPDVPTMDELGLKGFDSTGWFEVVGPAGMPPEVVNRLSQALLKAGEDKSLQDQYRQTGCDAEFLTPAQTLDKLKADHAKWGKVIKDANIKAE